MKTAKYAGFILCIVLVAGCANRGKYVNTRGTLDENIYYLEKDTSNSLYSISSSSYSPDNAHAVRVPQPALVDMNSTVQILIAKDQLLKSSVIGALATQSENLLKRKKAVVAALHLLEKVVLARHQVIVIYQKKDITQFYQAKKKTASIELAFLDDLFAIWPEDSGDYARLEEAYDPPSFGKLQQFLNKEIEKLEDANRTIEDELKVRQRSLKLEAFLSSPGKDPVAVHIEDYDSIKVESLAPRDHLGLNLSKEERDRLDAHVHSTQEIAAALERLRNGETSLNEAVKQMRSDVAPQLGAFIDEAERLYRRLEPKMLSKRKDETEKLLNAFLEEISKKNVDIFNNKKQELEKERDALLAEIMPEASAFSTAVRDWITTATALKSDWEKETTAAMVGLIERTVKIAKSFETLQEKLPQATEDARKSAADSVNKYLRDLSAKEKDILLESAEALALRSNLEGYYRDFRESSELIAKVAAYLGRLGLKPVDEMPPTSASFQVPLEDIKDTFIDLESTPRLPGDIITVKATLKDGEKVVDNSNAKFQIERYGYYADLSPAVVLIKPDELKGGNDGFRFAPVLSWMHHWAPRPEDDSKRAGAFRALDPSLGIHSAFTNFNSDTSNDTIQIGLGVTFSLWKNRLQLGAGCNLMANSNDQGRYYYFIGSDLIGLLQSIGLAKQ